MYMNCQAFLRVGFWNTAGCLRVYLSWWLIWKRIRECLVSWRWTIHVNVSRNAYYKGILIILQSGNNMNIRRFVMLLSNIEMFNTIIIWSSVILRPCLFWKRWLYRPIRLSLHLWNMHTFPLSERCCTLWQVIFLSSPIYPVIRFASTPHFKPMALWHIPPVCLPSSQLPCDTFCKYAWFQADCSVIRLQICLRPSRFP